MANPRKTQLFAFLLAALWSPLGAAQDQDADADEVRLERGIGKVVEEDTDSGMVVRELGPGAGVSNQNPGLQPYRVLETGGVEFVFPASEDQVIRILFGPQWTADLSEEAFHVGHFRSGQEMMIVGVTLPLSTSAR